MASYYYEKRMAYKIIDDLYKQGKSENEIILAIQTRFGFGKGIVLGRISIIEEVLEKNERIKQDNFNKNDKKDV